MPIDEEIQNPEPAESRRDALLASMEAVEASSQQDPATFDAATGKEVNDGRVRDESGRFAPKQQDAAPAPAAADPAAAPVVDAAPVVEQAPTLTTWRKEYLPIQQKLAAGQALTADEAQKLAAYNVQREKEYSTGVSTYKAEAQQAKQFTEAMAEFMPTLQQHGLQPAAWIQNLGRAHHTLALGSPEQKVQMFTRLAQDYGVPLGVIQQAQAGQVDPVALQLMQQMQAMQQQVQGVTSWRQQQEDQAAQQEISKFSDATQYPYFEQVRERMAQLLDNGTVLTPDEAYEAATLLDKSVRAQEQQRQAATQQASTAQFRQAAVTKARGAAVSVRSATPSGTTTAPTAKDRRAALEQAFEGLDSGRV